MDCPIPLRQLAETAALASAYSAHLIERPGEVPADPLQRFWSCCRRQQTVWNSTLLQFQQQLEEAPADSRPAMWQQAGPLLEEIFVSEMLIRVWSAVLTATDLRRGVSHAGPIARSVFGGHLEIRNLACNLLISGPQGSLNELAGVDRLRRASERWTDLLLGGLIRRFRLGKFAFDERRALDFAENGVATRGPETAGHSWGLILAGLRIAFPQTPIRITKLAASYEEIFAAIIGTFPAEAFVPDGPFRSLLQGRVARSGLIAEGPPKHPAGLPDTPRAARPAELPQEGISFAKLRQRRDEDDD